jgi:hypothetical protein
MAGPGDMIFVQRNERVVRNGNSRGGLRRDRNSKARRTQVEVEVLVYGRWLWVGRDKRLVVGSAKYFVVFLVLIWLVSRGIEGNITSSRYDGR